MGNEPSFTSKSVSSNLSNYEQIKTCQIGTVYKRRNSDQTFILKQYNFPSQSIYLSQYQKYKEMVEQYSKDQNSNMLAVKQVTKQQINHFCSNLYKIYVLYEYPNVTLRDEISARCKDNKYFQQAELWSIFQTCISALNQLKSTAPFSPKFIFISPDGVIKTLNSDLIDQNYRHFINQEYYYAPEKIANFLNQNQSQMSLKKQAVFSIGMTMLQASLLVDGYECYDFTTGQFQQDKMQGKLQHVLQSYSENFTCLLSGMLQVDPSKRLTPLQIQKYLNNFWEESEMIQNGHLNCIDQQNYQTNEELQKKCQELFNQKSQGNTNLPSSNFQQNYFDSEPSIPNLLSKQNSRINYNQIYMTGNQNEKNTDDRAISSRNSLRNYQQHNSILGSKEQRKQPTSTSNENLFTDPKLLEMIKKDLEQINQIRMSTSRQTQTARQSQKERPKRSPVKRQNCQRYKYTNQYEQPDQNIFYSNEKFHINDYKQVQSLMASAAGSSSDKCIAYRYEQSQLKNHQQRSQITQSIALSKLVFPQEKTVDCSKNDDNALREKDQNLPRYDMTKKANYKNCDEVYIEETYEDGVRYEGMTKNSMKHGYGKLIYNDGAYYQGYFSNDKINGKGTLFYRQNCPAYKGEWVNQQFHGYGQLFNEQPQMLPQPFNYMNFNQIQNFWVKYQGQFEYDNKCGRGKTYLTNGEYIQGQFQDDNVNGPAKFTDQYGTQICGIWQNNILRQINDQN